MRSTLKMRRSTPYQWMESCSLVVLSSVAQQEVENISNNVKKGLAMKMSRGEIVGFAGALGYDYDPQTKQMTVNQEQAKIVQYIFNRYVSGVGTSTIAHELMDMQVLVPPEQRHGIKLQLQESFAIEILWRSSTGENIHCRSNC